MIAVYIDVVYVSSEVECEEASCHYSHESLFKERRALAAIISSALELRICPAFVEAQNVNVDANTARCWHCMYKYIVAHTHADVLIHSFSAQCTWTALEIGNRISLNLKYFNSIILF